MDTAELADSPTLPEFVTVSQTPDIRFTPNEMRRMKDQTGRTMTQLMGEDAPEEDRLQAMVWLQLQRDGFDPTWDEAGDVAIRFEVDVPDPTKNGS